MAFIEDLQRTHYCGELRGTDAGNQVVLMGWVHQVRDMGGQVFVLLRDRTGLVQLKFDKDSKAFEAGGGLRQEWVVGAAGKVEHRGDHVNRDMATGEVEVAVTELEVLNKAATVPFVIRDETDAHEDLRLKYRYLDLRRPSVQQKMLLRHKATAVTRRYFEEAGFIEIETPLLMKSTPEGARDFLVPSRMHKGSFYALPQSPQIFKQISMVAGFDRYYQIARCFRDEDLRADRQLEFTQIDVEMSFINENDLMSVMEGLMARLSGELHGRSLELPLPRIPYAEAMERFGKDAPDMRFGMELKDASQLFAGAGFGVFKSIVEGGGTVRGICVPGGATRSRKQIEALTPVAEPYGAKGIAWVKVTDEGLTGSIAKFLDDGVREELLKLLEASEGDLLLFVGGDAGVVLPSLAALRTHLGPEVYPERVGDFKFCWVYDFPMFEYDEEDDRYVAMHHPFTQPKPEDLHLLESDPAKVRARAYDMVLNGVELGGGSIRIHTPELQSKVFTALGIDEEEAQHKFGFLLEALKYGAPPHGGIAFGMDRVVMLFAGADSIREVIAFPKTTSGTDLMAGSPTTVDARQLKELGIDLAKK